MIQQMIQRAMAGEDVSKEAELLEKVLPPEFSAMMQRGPFAQAGGMGAGLGAGAPTDAPNESAAAEQKDLSEEQARKIVEQAVAAGKLSKKEAENLIGAPLSDSVKEGVAQAVTSAPPPSKEKKFSKLWGGMFGKKSP